MGFEFSNSITGGGASCCDVVYMGCEFEIILKDDTQYFQSFNSGNTRYGGGRKMIISLDLELFKVRLLAEAQVEIKCSSVGMV